MLKWLDRRAARKRNAHNLYGSIVTLSRDPVLYTEYNVPDSLEGRFEIMVLHMYICLERLQGEPGCLAQDIVDRFFADMDTTQRELGVGDMVVPKKMRSLAVAFQHRLSVYKSAMQDRSGNKLAAVLEENILAADTTRKPEVKNLVRHVQRLRKNLSDMTIDDLEQGRVGSLGIDGAGP